MKRIFLLVLLVGISLAAFPDEVTWVKLPGDSHHRGYQRLNTYKYKYEACMTSGFPDTEQRYAGLKIVCDTEFYFSERNLAFLKIRNPQLFEVNGTSDDCSSESLKISPVSEELAPLLEKPVKFLYKEGKVETIFCSGEEPEYVLNIKRGILAFINHNFTKPKENVYEPRLYNNWEYGSQGLCENLYDVQYLTPSATNKIGQMKVSKTLNLKNCTKKPFSISSMNVGIGCMKEKCGVIDEPLKISISTSCDMSGKESNFFVRACETSSKYIFAPTHLKGSAATMVQQTLNFREVETGRKTYPDILDIPHKLKMTSDYENNDTAGINKQQTVSKFQITQLIEILIRNAGQKKCEGYHFAALVEMLKKVDKNTLINIWDHCFGDDQFRFWLLEALRYVYNQDVFDLIATKIKSQVLDPNQAVSVLLGFAFNTNPSEKMCQDISDLCIHPNVTGNETLKKTCYLVQGAMMHEYCRQKSKTCLENRALELKNRLKSADDQEKIYLVKMIGTFGHTSLYQPLLDIIKNTTNTLELRVTAVYALRRIVPRIPHKVLPVLLEIFRDKDSDAELRMACFVIICDSKPGPAVFNLILKQLSHERTNQVRSFVVSYIKGMAFSNYPCDEKMASTARFALRMLRKYRMGFQASKWIHWGEYSEPLQLGGSFDLQTLFTPSSFLPRAITSKLKIQLLGRSMNLFEVGVRGEGIQELLQRIVERKPESSNQGSFLSKLLPRNIKPYSFEKEVRQIDKMLPTAPFEETKTKGSFYFKVMGKELIYNYFTAEDVKHLTEDEAFDIKSKFTELLGEGKVFKVTKVFLPLDVTFAQPSAAGIPLKFTLQSVLFMHVNSTVKTAMETKFFLPFQASLTAKLNLSVIHSTWGTMKFSLPQLETGSKMKFDVNIASGMGETLRYNLNDHSYSTKLDLPQEKQQIFSIENQGYTFAMYTKPLKEPIDWRSLYRSTPLDGLEIGEVAPDDTFNDLVEMFLSPTLMGSTHRHAHYANWTLKTREGKYLSVNDENELTISDKPTVFRVIFIDDNRQFVKLFVHGKGYVKVKPGSTGCLETAENERYPKLFKVTHVKGPRFIRLETVVFIHPQKAQNPSEWTQTAAALNTEQVLLLRNMIKGMKPDTEFKDTWRYLTDLPSTEIPSTGLDDEYVFDPRHLKVLFITPVQGKVCLRPIRREESVFTVERQRTHVNELCYGEQMFGMDMCVSGEYTRPLMSRAPIFPFFGPAKFNVSIKPGKSAAQSIQFKFEKGQRFDDEYKTWKVGMYLPGTSPEKKIESNITYDVNNKKTNLTFDLLNMLPWLQRICIASHVISDEKATFDLEFGESCEEYQSQTVITVKEPGRRQLNITTSYEKLPYSVTKLFYKLFLAASRQFRDRLSDYKILRSARRKVQFVVKFKTEHLVDLEFILPSRTLTMDNVRVETGGFIPRGNPLVNLMQMSSPVCTVDYDTFRTFDGVEFQYSSPLRCPHILAKDCAGNSFMVLVSKEASASGNKVVEIFVEKQKIRAEYLRDGIYQIQVGGSILEKPEEPYQVSSVAKIVPLPDKKELRVLCENGLQVVIVRGTKVSIRVSPFLFNRTCGMCGDMNAEQYLDLKTPRGRPYVHENKQKYGHLWMVSEHNSSQVGCHLKKEHIEITKTIGSKKFQCFTTTPVLRCLKNCQVTESQTTPYPMTCVRSSNKELLTKIDEEITRRTLDLTGSQVYFTDDVTEHLACDCSVGDKRNI